MSSKRPTQPEAPALIAGPYCAPTCKPGHWINDELLGLVEVFGWTEAPLSWPRIRRKGPPAPVLTDELARAVRTESEKAIAHWWGVSIALVQRWRRELKVDAYTEGTRKLMRLANAAMSSEQRARNYAAMSAPEAHARSAARRRGKPANEAIRAALLRGAQQPKSREWGARANAWMLEGKAKARKPD